MHAAYIPKTPGAERRSALTSYCTSPTCFLHAWKLSSERMQSKLKLGERLIHHDIPIERWNIMATHSCHPKIPENTPCYPASDTPILDLGTSRVAVHLREFELCL